MGTAPPLRKVVVDDTDSAIQYGAVGWFAADPSGLKHGNFGPIYNGTTTRASSNSSFTFPFSGTSILVQGSIIVSTDANNVTDPTWTCTVDGIAIQNPEPTFQFPENNWPLCEQNTIPSGQHILTVEVTSKGQPFYFDSLIYTPSPDAVFESAVLLYPDGDPALSYGPGWKEDGEQVAQTANTQVTLNFYGTSATLISQNPSQYPPNATSGRYIIDGGVPVTFPLTGLASGTTTTQFNIPVFTTPRLEAGAHNLTIIYDGDIDHTPLAVKQFFVTNTTATSVPASDPLTTQPPTELDKPSGSNKGAIVGAVVAGVLVLALLVGIYLLRIRRRRRRYTDEMSAATSYPVMIEAGPARTYYAGFSSQSSSKHTRSATRSDAPYAPQPARAKSRPASPPTVILQHEDSGVRQSGPGQSAAALVAPIVVELPPGYSLA
ncbi:hypothetical protein C8F04DRAFT_1014661 [Mycena alexandri]|uniref:Uncharacterized protein n=1 Tax=Mycena alexandri TaxID=1745969 RepID=A0AAD6S375_9AGAR|nr:hypothetical protein C8F04DRAFT_1014661 [Mycena alexandri]